MSAAPAPPLAARRRSPTLSRPAIVALARRHAHLVPVLGSCLVSLVLLRHELAQVPYLNDAAVHEEMVRFALARIRSGHFPPASWFPYLNLGSPQFLHYQPLAAMLTALFGLVVGVGPAFTLTSWLLVACWPVAIYAAARLFGLSRTAAMAAAVASPFISSITGVGYEQISYLWSGYGLWTQLWAMWTLPFAWALTWRAVDERRYVVPAAVFVAATAALHFETGYLAALAIPLAALARPGDLARRAGRALLVAAGAAGMAAWVYVPVIAQGRWAAVNEFLQRGPEGVDANSYGARRVLAWLVDGDLLDWHHLLVLTPLASVGLVCAVLAAARGRTIGGCPSGTARVLVLLFGASLLLFFGRPTLGPLLDLLPGARDLFLRRFLIGVQLAAVLLVGVGASQLAALVARGLELTTSAPVSSERPARRVAGRVLAGALALAVLVPAWSFLVDQAGVDSSFIATQAAAAGSAAQIDALIATIQREGGGRTFAGDPSDWGPRFTVGEVPVFKYLASRDVDEVGFTLRTASLMSDAEAHFDEDDPADYSIFGIRWLLLPADTPPPVAAEPVARRGPYALWEIPTNGYVTVVDTRGSVDASSGSLGTFAGPLLDSLPAEDPIYPTVAYGGAPAGAGTVPVGAHPSSPPGEVHEQRAQLAQGRAVARVSTTRPAVVVLSVSFDPGWQATVDGRPAPTEMVAPALVGVRVGAGESTVRFVYRGFPDYPELAALGLVTLIGLVALERRRARHVGRLAR